MPQGIGAPARGPEAAGLRRCLQHLLGWRRRPCDRRNRIADAARRQRQQRRGKGLGGFGAGGGGGHGGGNDGFGGGVNAVIDTLEVRCVSCSSGRAISEGLMSYLDRRSAEWFVRPGDVVYDVGACLGAMSALYLSRGAAAVYAFEPLQRLRDKMPADLRSDPRFRLMPYALADRSGPAEMIVPHRNMGSSTLSSDFAARMAQEHGDDRAHRTAVEVRRLDDLALPAAAFWKIDVEGAELDMLRGAERTIQEARPAVIQVEIWKHDIRRYADTLTHIKARWPHMWALGGTPEGKVVHHEVTPQTVSRPEFHLDLARGGTPHYYASDQPFQWWLNRG